MRNLCLDDPALQREATSHYRVECIGGRWMLVTPEGHPIYSLGINHLSEQVGPVWFYDTNWWKDANSNPNIALENVLNTVLSLGYNSAGCYEEVQSFFTRELPSVVALTFPPKEIPSVYNYSFDIFDPDVKAQFAESIQQQCLAVKGRSNLMGYSFVDQPRYHVGTVSDDPQYASRTDQYRRMSATSFGKKRYIQFLEERYQSQIQDLNSAYNQTYSDFDALLQEEFSGLDVSLETVKRDDSEFLGVVAEALYSTLHHAVKSVDDQRLIFSEKFILNYTPGSVLKAAGNYVDVICAQAIRFLYWMVHIDEEDWKYYPEKELETWHRVSGKPILIADWVGPVDEKPEQEADQWLLAAAKQEFVIGVNRCRLLKAIDLNSEQGGLHSEMIRNSNERATAFVFNDLNSRAKKQLR